MQVNQNVNAANFLLVSSQAGNDVSVSNDKDTLDFASVLQYTGNYHANQSNVDSAYQTNVISSAASERNMTKMTDSVSDRQCVETNSSGTEESSETDKSITETKYSGESAITEKDRAHTSAETGSDSVEQMEETDDVTLVVDEIKEWSEEDMTAILEAIGNLLQNVMEQFDLSMDELNEKLAEFDMKPLDLLTQDGLKDFFLQMNGAEVSDLIVDENLNHTLQTFLSEISDVLDTLAEALPDLESFIAEADVKQMLEEMILSTESEGMISSETKEQGKELHSEGEPEVIVVNNNVQSESDASDRFDTADLKQQPDESKKRASIKDTMVTEQTATKQNTFENPILQALQNAVSNVEGMVASEQTIQQTDIVHQIVEQVRLNMNQQTTSLELQLYPEHLGRIQIHVVSKEGIMTASIVAESEAAKQAIEAGLLNLKEAFEQQDLKVEAIEVMVSTMGFEKGEEQQDSMNENFASNTRRRIDLSDLGEELPEEDEAELERMKATGSSVSYTA